MTDIDLFNKKFINTLSPYYLEYLWDLISVLGFKNSEVNEESTKKSVLKAIQIMLNLKVLKISNWIKEPELNKKRLSINETLENIDRIWFKGANYQDFYDMIMFENQKWYIESLEKAGMNPTTNWKKFVKENIGNLEKWINENKPKD